MTWRVARSLDVLLRQFNAYSPNRSKASDGSIGDAAHASRASDHNPWYGPGIVTARDFTHDPAHGMDIDKITDELVATRDPRIKYVIANGLILDSRPGNNPWRWVRYTGTNPHTKHFHLSVMASPICDDTRPWNLPMFGGRPTPPPPPAGNPGRFAWNLPSGHYYGNVAGPNQSHGGYYANERPFVRNIQQWLIYRGCVSGVGSSQWASSGWADGKWENATDAAMVNFHDRFYGGQPYPKQCWSDDYDRLARA